jgi:hypothetical protein
MMKKPIGKDRNRAKQRLKDWIGSEEQILKKY